MSHSSAGRWGVVIVVGALIGFGQMRAADAQVLVVRPRRVHHVSTRLVDANRVNRDLAKQYAKNQKKIERQTKSSRQHKTTSHGAAKGPLQSALDKMDLSPDQHDKIAALSQKADTDGKAAYSNRSLSSDQFRQRMADIDAGYRKGIEDLLTPDQRSRFESLLNQK